jgi:hypothetical protein
MENNFAGKCLCSLGKIEKSFSTKLRLPYPTSEKEFTVLSFYIISEQEHSKEWTRVCAILETLSEVCRGPIYLSSKCRWRELVKYF